MIGLVELLEQMGRWIFVEPREHLGASPSNAGGSLEQSLAVGILANREEELADCSFRASAVDFAVLEFSHNTLRALLRVQPHLIIT